MSFIKRWSLLMVVLACVAPSVGSSAPSVAGHSTGAKIATGLPPEVRLRKMHLVRPDLIPYPIEIEVYC